MFSKILKEGDYEVSKSRALNATSSNVFINGKQPFDNYFGSGTLTETGYYLARVFDDTLGKGFNCMFFWDKSETNVLVGIGIEPTYSAKFTSYLRIKSNGTFSYYYQFSDNIWDETTKAYITWVKLWG